MQAALGSHSWLPQPLCGFCTTQAAALQGTRPSLTAWGRCAASHSGPAPEAHSGAHPPAAWSGSQRTGRCLWAGRHAGRQASRVCAECALNGVMIPCPPFVPHEPTDLPKPSCVAVSPPPQPPVAATARWPGWRCAPTQTGRCRPPSQAALSGCWRSRTPRRAPGHGERWEGEPVTGRGTARWPATLWS